MRVGFQRAEQRLGEKAPLRLAPMTDEDKGKYLPPRDSYLNFATKVLIVRFAIQFCTVRSIRNETR